MYYNSKSRFIAFLCVACAVITLTSGCGKKELSKTDLIVEKNNIYKTEIIEFPYLNDETAVNGYYQFKGNYLYYVSEENDQENENSYRAIKRINIENGFEESVLGQEGESIYRYSLGKGGDLSAILYGDDPDVFHFVAADLSESISKYSLDVYVKISKNSGRPLFAYVNEDGSLGIICESSILLANENGVIEESLDFPEEKCVFSTDYKDDCLAIVIKGNSGYSLQIYDKKDKRIVSKTSIPFQASYVSFDGKNLILSDGGLIYSYSHDNKTFESITDLSEYGIYRAQISMIGIDDGIVRLLVKNEGISDKLINIDLEENAPEKTEKKTIKVLMADPDYSEMFVSKDMIYDFNLSNDTYRVQIMQEGLPDDGMEIAHLEELSPDIIVLPIQYTVEKYAREGLIDDLWPYIEKSGNIETKDLPRSMLSALEIDGRLYSISQRLTIQTLRLRKSDCGSMTGWTVDEFLNWLSNHPESYTCFDKDKTILLDYCLRCNLDEYVNFESGKSDFSSDAFVGLLNKVNEIDIKSRGSYSVSLTSLMEADGLPKGKTLLMDNAIDMFSGVFVPEFYFGEEVINLGYPNMNRNRSGILISQGNYSIYSGGNNKEGAYEFIEYCLTHFPYDYAIDAEGNIKNNQDCQIPMLKERIRRLNERVGSFNISYFDSNGFLQGKEYTVTDDHVEKIEQLIDEAFCDNLEKYMIRTIVAEEAENYFGGLYDSVKTADIIQSRVQVLLDENR